MNFESPQVARGASTLWTPHYEPPAASLDPETMEEDRFAAQDMAMARLIGEVLHENYPGYPWRIRSNLAQGVAQISIPILMGETGGYVLHINHLDTVSGAKKYVREAGGHILERYRIPRSTLDIAALMAASVRHPVSRHNTPFPV